MYLLYRRALIPLMDPETYKVTQKITETVLDRSRMRVRGKKSSKSTATASTASAVTTDADDATTDDASVSSSS
jgi:hypothetical protein